MKRIIIATMIIATTITVSGQTPADIAAKWKEIQECCSKYDNGSDSAYRMLNEQIAATKRDPFANAIWHSCLGQFLEDYYNENRHRLRNRTEVASEPPADFKEWDARTLQRRAREEYLLSLVDADILHSEPAKEYSMLLQEKEKVHAQQSLFDILAHRCMAYFREHLKRDENPENKFLQNLDLWNNTAFLNMELPMADTLPDISNMLSIYQLLTEFHMLPGHAVQVAQITLERFDFMRERGLALDNSITWYIDQLTKYGETCSDKDAYAYVAYKLGTLYAERSNEYDAELHPEFRNDLVSAVSFLQTALQNKQAEYKGSAKQMLEEIQAPGLKISPLYSTFPTESSLLFDIEYKQVTKAYIRLVPVSFAQVRQFQNHDIAKQYGSIAAMNPIFEEEVDLADIQDYRSHKGYYVIPKQRAGGYLLLISSKPFSNTYSKCTQILYFQVSDIYLTSRRIGDKVDFTTVHQQTGRPLENATIKLKNVRSAKEVDKYTLTSDKNGFATLQLPGPHTNFQETSVEWNKQTLYTLNGQWWWYYKEKDKTHAECKVFLDRMLYRPGQTVYFKGIVHQVHEAKGQTESMKLLANHEVEVLLFDANNQKIDATTLTTNDFGSFTGTFELPSSGLTGRYSINVKSTNQSLGEISFSVEEYKRPTFEVTLNKPNEMVKLGQPVTVEGVAEALSGYPIDGAAVSYHVTRTTSFPWWSWRCPSSDPRTIVHGTTETDDKGGFSITFPTEEDLAIRRYTPLYQYDVEVVVTDINGETHQANVQVQVSRRSIKLAVSIPEEVEITQKESRFPLSLTNIADVPQDGEVWYEIYRLQTPNRYYFPVSDCDTYITPLSTLQKLFPNVDFENGGKQESWDSESLGSGRMQVSKYQESYFSFSMLDNIQDGYYKVKFSVQDPGGDKVEEERIVHLYRNQTTKCTGYKPLWYDFPFTVGYGGYSIDAGDTLQFSFGSYLKDAKILCEIAHNDSVVHTKWYDVRQKTVTIQWPTKPTDQGTLSVHLFMQADGNTYQLSPNVHIVNHAQDIRFEFLRFRDKTLPGSQEELQVRLTDKDGNPVSAELLCSMYDYSLDELGGRNFHNLRYDYTFRNLQLRYDERYSTYEHLFSDNPYYRSNFSSPVYRTPFSNFKDFCFVWYGFYPRAMAKGGVVLHVVEDNISVNSALEYDVVEEESVLAEPAAVFVDKDEVAADQAAQSVVAALGDSPAVQIRTNFNETAFFYPQLRTDENGNVYISYTMPDALTKWKLQGVAHNTDLMYGRFDKFVQTAKDVMIVPNAPRFLREGDTMDFSAKVVNTSGKHISGNVTLEFFNAVNNRPVAMICDEATNNGVGRDAKFCVSTTEGSQQYDIAAGASQEIRFRIVVPEGVPAVTYRIIAHNTEPADVVGDGEEKTLPVLSNRMLVTETMPFHISGKGTKTFTFTKLQNSFDTTGGRDAKFCVSTLKHFRLTVECTPNPVWYAIQAMPYMMEYPYECNEQMFCRYYANTLATSIIKANPIIEEVFNRWQTEPPDAFCSALEKNQELKQVVLEETPWVLDAQREGADKQRVAMLFDFKRMAKEAASTLKKLQKGQNGDGGWPWFAGGESSDFITRHIVAGFGHLKALAVSSDMAQSSLRQAVSYMDAQMYKRYLDRKKYNIDYVNETHYLYARSFYSDKLAGKYKVAYDTCYKAMLASWKDASFYTQAMIALTAWRNGDQKVAREIVKNLKSMAQHDEEMGMFWKKQGGGWFWYEQPVERQAMLIEAFHTITPEDAESLAEMQLWLLKQKQTQHWGTTKSTTEAIYALLLNQELTAGSENVTLNVGSVTLPDKEMQTEAGTGYFKKAWSGEEITSDMATVTIQKTDKGPAWGGMYWQYFEDMDKITRSDDKNLVIKKQLFKVVNTDKGEVLQPITEDSPLSVGDKVRVRVVITCDRDMEYVHLKDQRAATFEPVNVFSRYKYQDGLWYYEATKDAATHFFIDWMRKGKYVFEYTLFATQSGNFSNGITEIECMYAPEFRSHSGGVRVNIVR